MNLIHKTGGYIQKSEDFTLIASSQISNLLNKICILSKKNIKSMSKPYVD